MNLKVNYRRYVLIAMVLLLTLASPNAAFAAPSASADASLNLISGSGFWISQAELAALPIAGQANCLSGSLCYSAWNDIVTKANPSNWLPPDIAVYPSSYEKAHHLGVMAAAIACARTGQSTYCANAKKGLDAVVGTEQKAVPSATNIGIDDGSLAISRALTSYVIAADLIGYYPWASGYRGYTSYVDYMLHAKFTTRAGDGGFTLETLHKCASNGCTMAGAARIAAAAYLKNTAVLDDAWNTFRRYAGDTTSPVSLVFSKTGLDWYYNVNNKLGINPKSTTCYDTPFPADGVIPNDQGRSSACPTTLGTAPAYVTGSQYPWEGLQGAFAQALMLNRLGYKDASGRTPWQIGDSALLRAAKYQYYLSSIAPHDTRWYDNSRAAWVKQLLSKYYGYKPVAYRSSGGARNADFTQWTHQ